MNNNLLVIFLLEKFSNMPRDISHTDSARNTLVGARQTHRSILLRVAPDREPLRWFRSWKSSVYAYACARADAPYTRRRLSMESPTSLVDFQDEAGQPGSRIDKVIRARVLFFVDPIAGKKSHANRRRRAQVRSSGI